VEVRNLRHTRVSNKGLSKSGILEKSQKREFREGFSEKHTKKNRVRGMGEDLQKRLRALRKNSDWAVLEGVIKVNRDRVKE